MRKGAGPAWDNERDEGHNAPGKAAAEGRQRRRPAPAGSNAALRRAEGR